MSRFGHLLAVGPRDRGQPRVRRHRRQAVALAVLVDQRDHLHLGLGGRPRARAHAGPARRPLGRRHPAVEREVREHLGARGADAVHLHLGSAVGPTSHRAGQHAPPQRRRLLADRAVGRGDRQRRGRVRGVDPHRHLRRAARAQRARDRLQQLDVLRLQPDDDVEDVARPNSRDPDPGRRLRPQHRRELVARVVADLPLAARRRARQQEVRRRLDEPVVAEEEVHDLQGRQVVAPQVAGEIGQRPVEPHVPDRGRTAELPRGRPHVLEDGVRASGSGGGGARRAAASGVEA